jgi:ribosomal protein S12 methylthiotransferase accessory factor
MCSPSKYPAEPVAYVLELETTESATGYFSCKTADPLAIEDMISRLRFSPYDDFMHQLLLRAISGLSSEAFEALCRDACNHNDRIILSALHELDLLAKSPFKISPPVKGRLERLSAADFSAYTPLIVIKSQTAPDRDANRKWVRLFRENIFNHAPLPSPEVHDLPFLFDAGWMENKYGIKTDPAVLRKKHCRLKKPVVDSLPTLEQTAQNALEKLEKIKILRGPEMRHEASLSPIALLRRWEMRLSVANRRNDYTLSGIQTSYGRGLTLEAARASNLMEIAERYASFAGIDQDHIPGYAADYRLIHGSFSSLQDRGISILNPNALALEAPYLDEPLHWMEAEIGYPDGPGPIWIPVQTVFPFCNLDEPDLFSGLGSTGLASGNTPAQAKVSALLEIIERDAEATMPYSPSLCFTAESEDPAVAALFDAYRKAGIEVFFQDLTSGFGVPCCKCVVRGTDGKTAKGVGAHLSAQKALLSALTETPYPFPNGPRSGPGPAGLLRVPLEKLPDYATGDPDLDLAILEEILLTQGYQPIYVNLRRNDTQIPVVRAIVPGLEIMADFDEFSRISERLFLNYLHLSGQKGPKT